MHINLGLLSLSSPAASAAARSLSIATALACLLQCRCSLLLPSLFSSPQLLPLPLPPPWPAPASCAVREVRGANHGTNRWTWSSGRGREQLDGAARRRIHVLPLPSSLLLSPLFPISPLARHLLFISLVLAANLSLLRRPPPSKR
jgi:hypothetical protein